MAELKLRPARADEARLLSDLAFQSKAFWGYSPEFMAACRAELTYTPESLARMLFIVAEGDTVVGFYGLTPLAADAIELEALFVAPEFIGAGHGRTLIEDAKRRARSLGARQLVIQSDPHAEAFYRAAGGKLTGTLPSASIPGRSLPVLTIQLERG